MPEKICSGCGKPKDETEFGKYVDKTTMGNPVRIRKKCNVCRTLGERNRPGAAEKKARQSKERYTANPSKYRKYKLKVLYGLTLEQYDAIMVSQNGKCGICGLSFEEIQPYVDHCHSTSRVRGILCNNCNNGLGRFMDNPDYLRKAVRWLEELDT